MKSEKGRLESEAVRQLKDLRSGFGPLCCFHSLNALTHSASFSFSHSGLLYPLSSVCSSLLLCCDALPVTPSLRSLLSSLFAFILIHRFVCSPQLQRHVGPQTSSHYWTGAVCHAASAACHPSSSSDVALAHPSSRAHSALYDLFARLAPHFLSFNCCVVSPRCVPIGTPWCIARMAALGVLTSGRSSKQPQSSKASRGVRCSLLGVRFPYPRCSLP